MKRLGILFAAIFLVLAAPSSARAQADDPSEVFLKAYMTAQQGEKLERENQFKPALAKFRFAGTLLEELRKGQSDWQPAIVAFRAKKIGESILRVESKISTQRDLAATAGGGPANAPGGLTEEPRVEIDAGKASSTATSAATESAIRAATANLRSKVDELQGELKKSHDQYSAAQKEKEELAARLQETAGKLDLAQSELEKTRKAETEVKDQLAQAQSSLTNIQSSAPGDKKAQEALRAEIAQLKKALDNAQAGRVAAEKESAAVKGKLVDANNQIVAISKERDSVTRERNDALAQLKVAKQAQERVEALVAENTDLKGKLAEAEKTVREISEDKPKKAEELAEVKRQLEELRNQLIVSQKQNQDFEVTISELRSQMDEASGELERAKLNGTTAEESARLVKENGVLRNIVVRERQEEARREQAKKLMLAEFSKLKVKSDTLTQQVELLAQPITKLSNEELSLLKEPVVNISEKDPSSLQVSMAVAKPPVPVSISDPNAAKEKEASPGSALQTTAAGGTSAIGSPDVETSFKPSVPAELVPLAKQAKENFDRGKYREAERQYQQLLAKTPNNLYSLSNLGVVLFRTGKLKAAELTLKKAVAVAPQDEFSHTTLGIVFYRQGKFDDALSELTKALAINPKSATAHNYLGITASQKGWQEAAEKEMLEALAANPDYADAHFNLAVIYATAQPPAKELAKRHYSKAVALGADSDPSLERLLR